MSTDFLSPFHRVNQTAGDRFAQTAGGSLHTTRELHVLAALNDCDGTSAARVILATGLSRDTLAPIVRGLHKNGLVRQCRSQWDAQRYAVTLTPRGQDALAAGMAALSSVEKDLLSGLSDEERVLLQTLLRKVVDTRFGGGDTLASRTDRARSISLKWRAG